MSFKSKLLAGAAAVTLVGGVGTAGAVTAGPANAATPSCGSDCVNIFSQQLSDVLTTKPHFVLDVWRQGAKLGQPIIMFRSSNSDPAEDFTLSLQGTVDDFATAGLVSAAVDLHYGKDFAFEIEYAPFGVNTGLCVGLFTTAFNGEKVALEPCGVSAKTVWIDDQNPGDVSFTSLFFSFHPWINGSTTTFSHPFVLTYPANAFPTDIPRPQLTVRNLARFSDGTIRDNQMWAAFFGVLQ